jgi:SAM-dependent methyltransferase
MAERVGGGRVTGVDADLAMVAKARRRLDGHPAVHVCEGDAHALPVAGASVDRARFDRVTQHLADPAKAVAEAARVLRPGGMLVVSEPDWDTLAIDDPDIETSRAYTRYVTRHVVRNAAIGRQLPRLATGAGLAVRDVVAAPILFTSFEAADTILRLDSVLERAVADGAVDAVPAARWADRRRTEPLLAALTCFMVAAVRSA